MFSSHFKHKPAATKSKLVSYYERTAPQICDKQATNPDTSMFLWKVWVLRQAVRPSRCSISSDFEQTWKNGVWCVCRCSVACMFRLLLVWLLCLDAPQAFEEVGTPMFAHNFESSCTVSSAPDAFQRHPRTASSCDIPATPTTVATAPAPNAPHEDVINATSADHVREATNALTRIKNLGRRPTRDPAEHLKESKRARFCPLSGITLKRV